MRVKREAVLDFIISRGFQPFTTTDVAEALCVKEYAARAAVSWLRLGGFIDFHSRHDTREHVKVYIWTGKCSKPTLVRRDEIERQVRAAAEQRDRMTTAANALEQALRSIIEGRP